MGALLRAKDPDLRDLPTGSPLLYAEGAERPTGARFLRWIGAGAMSAVFLAELPGGARSRDLSQAAPPRLAVKLLKPAFQHEAARMNIDVGSIFEREVLALSRIMERQPPTELVVGYYGSGHCLVEYDGQTISLPWLAIEYVDGGTEGVTLTDRVQRVSGEGVDPVRAFRLMRGILDGAHALHEEGILHRDLKPDNVLVTGPLDDETPKLADCGIARIDGIMGTLAAMTPAYGGPEQLLSKTYERNPLIGPWTDVHALAALAWFVLGGDQWRQGDNELNWHRGGRRSLRTAPHLHEAFATDSQLIAQIDAVLARGAAPRLPAEALAAAEAGGSARSYIGDAQLLFPSMFEGEPRFAGARELAGALLPLLRQCAANWSQRCAAQNRASTAYRKTELGSDVSSPVVDIEEVVRSDSVEATLGTGSLLRAEPGSAVFQPDGKVLVRFGERLLYFVGGKPHKVAIPKEHQGLVAASSWLVRGPVGGFAAVGTGSILLIRGNSVRPMPLPQRPGGGEVGPISAAIGTAGVFGIVTAETDDSNGGAELWTSPDGLSWDAPLVLPLGGDVRAVSLGPYGYLVVGARRGTKGRALFLPFNNNPVLYVAGVNERPPLTVALCGAGREAWAAGAGFVLSLDRGAVTPEEVECTEEPVALALDLQGIPWLLTKCSVMRRHVQRGNAVWRRCYRREPGMTPFVAIGFVSEGAHVLDAGGNAVILRLSPEHAPDWKGPTGPV